MEVGGPESGERVWITGETAKVRPLLLAPPEVTVTGPVATPGGAGTTIDVLLHDVGTAGIPLKSTCVAP